VNREIALSQTISNYAFCLWRDRIFAMLNENHTENTSMVRAAIANWDGITL